MRNAKIIMRPWTRIVIKWCVQNENDASCTRLDALRGSLIEAYFDVIYLYKSIRIRLEKYIFFTLPFIGLYKFKLLEQLGSLTDCYAVTDNVDTNTL